MMDKKGDISMNTLIIAIIAIIVLLLIVTFFTGGMSTVFSKIRDVFTGGTAGYDLELAKANCENYCVNAEDKLGSADLGNAAYCKKTFAIDKDFNNKIDDTERDVHCWENPIGITCGVNGDKCISAA